MHTSIIKQEPKSCEVLWWLGMESLHYIGTLIVIIIVIVIVIKVLWWLGCEKLNPYTI